MAEQQPDDISTESAVGANPAKRDWERRRRLADVFGEVLPDTTADERDDAPPDSSEEAPQDRWLRSQVPPHHG